MGKQQSGKTGQWTQLYSGRSYTLYPRHPRPDPKKLTSWGTGGGSVASGQSLFSNIRALITVSIVHFSGHPGVGGGLSGRVTVAQLYALPPRHPRPDPKKLTSWGAGGGSVASGQSLFSNIRALIRV